ncbi:DUF2325 domain-containing protein [Burkholderia sp. Ac-20353]|uniref:DUF2325 domain-containing protein n=1 Tax=Burkholderia sp. Ac-20353 TaxID=2703894 RepID=UPI00197BFD03|nr:DUF2325 domain-containing protein [Burkholderia sp. Ac-20353]MBN3785387.1 DUF2325 domain-containing protein [Burkholderia sp. Ac-20353]
METPPFRLSPLVSGSSDSKPIQPLQPLQPLQDRCCERPPLPAPATRPAAPRRARLAELDPHIHCSVIGTCLTTAELRKLVPRYTDVDREHASDLQIHNAAVELAAQGGDGAKALHKALDQRYAPALKRVGLAKDVDALRTLWRDALKTGDVPPAYWAIVTHPAATLEMRQLAFGDVHMLSHLVGAANRADIRRLVALEDENAALTDKIERQQARLQTLAVERDAEVRALRATIDALTAVVNRRAASADSDQHAELARLRDAVSERDAIVALHASRCRAAEDRLKEEQLRVQALRAQLDEGRDTIATMKSEAHAMEQAILRTIAEPESMPPTLERARGKRIVYVGGRPGSHAAIRRLVESAGGTLTVHDGGIEDRKGKLAASIPGADLVVFPVDCIDHDSMNTLKRVCERHRIAYRPLRTASVASFVDLMSDDQDDAAQLSSCTRVSAFCLRHG